jgi:hypothetical protein
MVLLLAPVAFAVDKTVTPAGNYQAPDKYKSFIEDFHNLMKRHPDAAKRFSLFDMSVEQPVAHEIIWP